MKEISDILNAIPQMQTAASFGCGFVVGAVTRYMICREYWLPGGALLSGIGMAKANQGLFPNYAVDIGAAIMGDYAGSHLVAKLLENKEKAR